MYEVILADPPWHYDNRVQKGRNSEYTTHVTDYYPTMTVDEIKRNATQTINTVGKRGEV